MLNDYKISEERESNGVLTYQKVRFYEGSISTENEKDVVNPGSSILIPVTRYRRKAMISEVEYIYE